MPDDPPDRHRPGVPMITRSAEADAAAAATSDVGGDPSANVDVPGALWVYLAGPMRGRRDFNAPAFRAAAARLRAAGHVVFCPVERNDLAGFTPDGRGLAGDDAELTAAGFDVRAALGDDLAWITRQAHAVVVLPGWESSRGAVAEVATARALGLPVWELDALLAGGEPLGMSADPGAPRKWHVLVTVPLDLPNPDDLDDLLGVVCSAVSAWDDDRHAADAIVTTYADPEPAATQPGRSADEIGTTEWQRRNAAEVRAERLAEIRAAIEAALPDDLDLPQYVGPLIAERDNLRANLATTNGVANAELDRLRRELDEAEQVRDSALAGEDAAERAVARVREACAAVTRDGVPRDVAEYERIKWLGANWLARELLDLTDPHAGHDAGATAGGRG